MVNKIKSIPMIFRHNEFGSDCLAARTEIGMTCEDVAKHINIHSSTVAKYERGCEENPKMNNFLDLCNLYDLDPRKYFELK